LNAEADISIEKHPTGVGAAMFEDIAHLVD
jgi:hypothetical protein